MEHALHILARSTDAPRIPAPKGRWLTRWVLPVGSAAGAGLLLLVANRDKLFPRLPVRAVPAAVVVAAANGAAPSSADAAPSATTATVSVQAPGWVEPDPHPIYVTALADGIVEELLVLEGERVERGQVVARLVSEDAELEVDRAEAVLARRQAVLAAAETEWAEPVDLQRALAVASARLAEARADRLALQADLAGQKALLGEAEALYQSVRPLAGEAAPEVEVDAARLTCNARRAAVAATEARLTVAAATLERLAAEQTAARRHLELRVEHRRRLDEGRAAVAEAAADLEVTRLRLRRMEVVSPAAGTVMDRLVAPGTKVMRAMDGATSAHIVHLYDPERLQVRVDVPLADAALIRPGQPARIVVDVLPDTEFSGRVTRFVHQADISKNTVQVKVTIDDPSAHVKPDLLARVRFLAAGGSASAGAAGAGSSGLRVFVPRAALDGDGTAAWVLDAAGERVSRRDIVVGAGRRSGWLEVVDGLHAGDVVVASPPAGLTDGARVRVVDEEDMP